MTSVKQETEGVNQETEDVNHLVAAFTPCLPQVYLVYLLFLINEVIKPETAQTLEVSLPLLLPHLSKARLAAFLHQSLSALGCKGNGVNETMNKLNAEADQTFSLQSSYPNLWSMAKEKRHKIYADVSSIGTNIDMTLLGFFVEVVRLSLLTLLPAVEVKECFYELFDRLLKKTASPSESASIVHSVLCYFNCRDEHVSNLAPYLIPGFSLRQSYPDIFLKLRIAEFLSRIGDKNCKLAMMAFSRMYLGNEAIDKYSPLEFVGIIFDRGQKDIEKLNKLAAAFNLNDYFNICRPIQAEVLAVSSSDTSDEYSTPLTTPIPSGASPIEDSEVPITPQDRDGGMTTRMKFMIERYHPETDDFTRLDKFMADHFNGPEDPSFPPPPTSPPTVVDITIVQDGIDSPPIRETPPPVDGTDPPVDDTDPPADGTAGGNTSNTSCCKRHWKLMTALALLISLLVLIVACGAVAAGLYSMPSQSSSSTSEQSVNIYENNENPVLLPGNHTCVELPSSVNASHITSTAPLNTSTRELPVFSYKPPSPCFTKCDHYNYYEGRHSSINLGPGSKLFYNVTIYPPDCLIFPDTSSPTNSSYRRTKSDEACMRLYLGKYSKESVDHVFNGTGKCNLDDSIIQQSGCLSLEPGATETNVLVVFNITEQDDYYVAYETTGDYYFGTDITVSQVVYNISSIYQFCLASSSSNSTCQIGTCHYPFFSFNGCKDEVGETEETFRVFIQAFSGTDTIVNYNATAGPGIRSLISCTSISFFIGGVVSSLGVIICIVFLLCWYVCKRCCKSGNYEDSFPSEYGTFCRRESL